MEDLSVCLESKDFEGAEILLTRAEGEAPQFAGFFHYQFGRLYHRWNKLTSAIHHLNLAVDLSAKDEMLKVQVLDELKTVKGKQLNQRP